MVQTLAVDIGGTKVAAGIIDKERNWTSSVTIQSDKTNANTMYASVLKSIDEAIKKAMLTRMDILQIGVTVPGQFDIEKGLAIYQNNLPWKNFPIRTLLKKEFPKSNIAFEHDVVAAARGEWAVRNFDEELLVFITVSTGISASIINKGVPIRGVGFAGEIGFFPTENEQDLEKIASGSAMEKALPILNKNLTLQQAFRRWHDGDAQLSHFFSDKAYQIARAVFHVAAMLDPHKIVLGGGVINHQRPFYEQIKHHYTLLCHHPFQKKWKDKIEHSVLKEKAGLFGVATQFY